MDDQHPHSPATPPVETLDPAPADQPAWTVRFVVPSPPNMPSDRLKARAELVRAAGCCCDCGSSY